MIVFEATGWLPDGVVMSPVDKSQEVYNIPDKEDEPSKYLVKKGILKSDKLGTIKEEQTTHHDDPSTPTKSK